MSKPVGRYASVDSALAQVMAKMRVERRTESVPSRLAYGRVSAGDVFAPADVPRFPTSHWDGYAVMAEDVSQASESHPVSLRIVGAVRPGARPRLAIAHGEAAQVATGAPLPTGADAVVPVESAESRGAVAVMTRPTQAGSHVYRAGEDVREGETILRRGQTIRAQDVGLLISLGVRKTRVRRRPRISVMATGSELTEAGRPRIGRVENSHSPVFLRIIEGLGCDGVDMGIVRDDAGLIAKRLRAALARSDFVFTLGGTSAGRHDYVAGAIERLGPDVIIHGIKMDRGRVTGVAVVKGRPVLMMPGPIQGAMNALLLLGVPIIDVLAGSRGRQVGIPCTFSAPWKAREQYADFRKVVYVKLQEGREATAMPLGGETESMRVLAEADGYVIVPENVTRIDAGGRVMVTLLPGFSFA